MSTPCAQQLLVSLAPSLTRARSLSLSLAVCVRARQSTCLSLPRTRTRTRTRTPFSRFLLYPHPHPPALLPLSVSLLPPCPYAPVSLLSLVSNMTLRPSLYGHDLFFSPSVLRTGTRSCR